MTEVEGGIDGGGGDINQEPGFKKQADLDESVRQARVLKTSTIPPGDGAGMETTIAASPSPAGCHAAGYRFVQSPSLVRR